MHNLFEIFYSSQHHQYRVSRNRTKWLDDSSGRYVRTIFHQCWVQARFVRGYLILCRILIFVVMNDNKQGHRPPTVIQLSAVSLITDAHRFVVHCYTVVILFKTLQFSVDACVPFNHNIWYCYGNRNVQSLRSHKKTQYGTNRLHNSVEVFYNLIHICCCFLEEEMHVIECPFSNSGCTKYRWIKTRFFEKKYIDKYLKTMV